MNALTVSCGLRPPRIAFGVTLLYVSGLFYRELFRLGRRALLLTAIMANGKGMVLVMKVILMLLSWFILDPFCRMRLLVVMINRNDFVERRLGVKMELCFSTSRNAVSIL